MNHRQELADFLRKSRARRQPGEVGLAVGGRRRTPGLKREEVALLAGISATYYTYLEQARPVHPSLSVLEGLCRALRLDPGERSYLIALGRPEAEFQPPETPESVEPDLAQLLGVISPCPAWIVNRYRDVLAWTRTTKALIADWPALPAPDRNMLRWALTDPHAQDVLVEWAATTRAALVRFRVDFASNQDPSMHAFVDRLLESSPYARTWWDDHRIISEVPSIMRFRDRDGAIIETRLSMVRPATPSDQQLIIHTPAPGTDAEDRFRDLEASTEPD